MPKFFINRPIFAVVIAIMVMLAGLLAIKILPVSQYPPIAPPQITINAMYPGASAQTVQRQGIQVLKSTRNFLLIVGLVSEDGSMDRHALTDYLVSNVQDIVSRLEGVGELQQFGTQHAVPIWLDPSNLK